MLAVQASASWAARRSTTLPLPLLRPRPPGAAPLGARSRAAAATLEEVLEAARIEEASTAEASEGSAAPGGAGGGASSAASLPGQKGVLWFANIYPTKAFKFDFRQELTHKNHLTMIPDLLPKGVEVVRMVPREREGGAFVYFRAPPAFVLQVLRNLAKDEGSKEQRFMKKEDILSKVCSGISQYLKTHEVRAFLCPFPVRAHRVQGDPYLEDLQSRFPSARLRVRVEPANSLSEERIFELLRRYGELQDIEKLADGKGFSASFNYVSAAVAARNCLHRATVEGSSSSSSSVSGGQDVPATLPKLHIEFEPFMRKWVREAITSNARYTIPLMAAMLVGTTYFIWDPLRAFSVQIRLAGLFSLPAQPAVNNGKGGQGENSGSRSLGGLWGLFIHGWGYYNKAQDSILKAARQFQAKAGSSLLADFWADRSQEVNELRRWLTDPQDRVLLLTGHRGNGQTALVREVMGVDAIHIDVASMLEAGGAVDDRIFLRHLCKSLGYWPPQGMDRQMTAILDLMLPGSGKLSRENEVLVSCQRVFSSTTQAMLLWKNRWLRRNSASAPPLPLIIVTGFTAENKARREGFFDTIVTWAAYVSEHQLARVLFIADSSFAEPAMVAALGNRPERLDVQELTDAGPGAVRRLLENHFGAGYQLDLSEEELAMVGGRFRDIAALVAQIHEGAQPKEAVRRLVETAEKTVRGLLMRGQQGAKWTRPQLWRSVRLLASSHGSDHGVPYDVFLWNVFRGDEVGLQSMKESGLITVATRGVNNDMDGPMTDKERAARRYKVLPGSPLFAEVYWRLTDHAGLAAVLDLEVAKEDIKRECASLHEYEADLVRLQEVDDVRHNKWRSLRDPNEALRKRKEQLLQLILEQHKKLEGYHKARRAATATLGERKEKFSAVVKEERKAAAATAAVASELAHSKSQGGLLDRIGLGFLARFGLAF